MGIRISNANNAAFLGVTIAFGAIALAMGLGWFGEWREPECTGYPVQGVASPSGALRAIQEQEACGSTDRLRTTVMVHQAGRSEGALVFDVVTGKALGAMSVGQRTLPLVLRWKSDAELVIDYPAAAKPETPVVAGGALRVTYQPKPAR